MPLDEFGANLESMVQYLQSVGVPAERVVLITPPPLWEAAWERECLAKGKQCLATQVPTRMLVLVEGASRDPSYNVSHGRHEPGGHRWGPPPPGPPFLSQLLAQGILAWVVDPCHPGRDPLKFRVPGFRCWGATSGEGENQQVEDCLSLPFKWLKNLKRE